jgi:hypothetical protein
MEMVLRTFWVRPTVWAELQRVSAIEERSASSLLREAVTNLLRERTYVLPAKPLPKRRSAKK